MYRLSLLPVGLIALLLTSTALAAEPTTPEDPFYHITKFSQRPPDPPVCCLRPLPSSEPAEEVLSFEEWKTKQEEALLQQRQEQLDGAKKARDAASRANESSATQKEGQYEANAADAPPPLESPVPPPPHFRVPLTDRFNYAGVDCSARVHYAHRSARSSSSLLSSKKDRYMLSPCNTPGEDKFVIVELCEDIRIDTVQLANFEFFSGVFKDFSVSVARTYTTDPEGWTPAGTYRAKNIRGIQSFHPPTSLRDFYRFIRIDIHSHYGNEYYCPISLLRVYGLTHLEQWKWELWEAEYQAKNDAAVRSIAAGSAVAAEGNVHIVKGTLDKEEPVSTGVVSSSTLKSSPGESFASTISSAKVVESETTEATATNMVSEDVTVSPIGLSHTSKLNEEPTRFPPSESLHRDGHIPPPSDISPSPIKSSNQDHTLPESSSSMPLAPSDSSTVAQSSDASSSHLSQRFNTTSSSLTSSTAIPTIVAHESRAVPAVTSTGESIYRTIMTRLSLLETNSTLYLRYVEEQSRSLRDALTRLEEDVGRLDGLSKATTQSFQKIINEIDRQRRRLEREHGELQTRVDYLTDEVILEKRLGIAQLCLLLVVLMFMALTRGSRGEPFVAQMSSGRRDALREWGRRHLSSFGSGEWTSKLKSGSPTHVPGDFVKSPVTVKSSDKVDFPTLRTQGDGDRTPQQSSSTSAVPPSMKGRVPADIRVPHPRHFVAHRPRTPVYTQVARSAGLLGASNSAQGTGRPRIRRASSHSTPVPATSPQNVREVTPAIPLSAKKWAKSAHLHEIRKAGPKRNADARKHAPSTSSQTADDTTIRVRQERENLGGELKTDSDVDIAAKQPLRPNSGDHNYSLEHNDDRIHDPRHREPFSISPLQNRLRGRAGADIERLRLEQSPPNGPRIIDLDTESENWEDTDVEASDAEVNFK